MSSDFHLAEIHTERLFTVLSLTLPISAGPNTLFVLYVAETVDRLHHRHLLQRHTKRRHIIYKRATATITVTILNAKCRTATANGQVIYNT